MLISGTLASDGPAHMMRLSYCLLILLATAILCPGSFLDSDIPSYDSTPKSQQWMPRSQRVLPQPPPGRISRLVDHCLVGRPYSYNGLTIYPVRLKRDLVQGLYVTMDEGLAAGTLQIRETGKVARLEVINRGRAPVFLLAGEIVVGGRQNRMVSNDVLINAGDTVRVPVYCIEKGRWAGDVTGFVSAKTLGLPDFRELAGKSAAQDEVWRAVSEASRKVKVSSETEDFQKVYDHAPLRKQLDTYKSRYRRLWRKPTAGIVVVRFGRIVGADIFGNSAVFAALRPKLLDSYILDRLQYPDAVKRRKSFREPNAAQIREYLNTAKRATTNAVSTPGRGRAFTLSDAANGTALTINGDVLHLNLMGPPPVRIYRRVER